MSNSKLELNNIVGIEEISDCIAETLTGGNFSFAFGPGTRIFDNFGTGGQVLTLPVDATGLVILNTNPGASNPNNIGHNFTVEYQTLDGTTVDTEEVSFGNGVLNFDRAVADGAQQVVITQAS